MIKKLFLLFSLATILSCQPVLAQGLVSISTFYQVEKINNVIQTTAPINLQYAYYKAIDSTLFWFGGVDVGHAFIQGNGSEITLNNLVALAGIGGQISQTLPLIGAGVGYNFFNNQPIFAINLDFYVTSITGLAVTKKYTSPPTK